MIIRLNLANLPPTARRQPILVLRRSDAIATFVRRHQWTNTYDNVVAQKSLVRILEFTRLNGEALVAGYGVIALPKDRTAHRLLIANCWSSELEQTRRGLATVVTSYLAQLAGLEIAGEFYFTELTDNGETR